MWVGGRRSVTTYKAPAAAGQTNDGKTKTTFVTRGRVAGDVLLYRLDSGKYLGSFSFDAQNGPIFPSSSFDSLSAELKQSYVSALSTRGKASAPALNLQFAN